MEYPIVEITEHTDVVMGNPQPSPFISADMLRRLSLKDSMDEQGTSILRPLSAEPITRHPVIQVISDYGGFPASDNLLALKAFLFQIDMTRYGFGMEPEPPSNKIRSPKSLYASISSSDSEDYPMRRKTKSPRVPKSPKSLEESIKRSQSASPRGVPYKGRHGPNPVCASCGTTSTPYWRDSWNQGFILCNACGLRYSKFRRRCEQCNYVPRKEDKYAKHCVNCGGNWTT